jgi:EAL domain-containing protein (putative c-di-GMP-specific phosphodiesterase class I)
MMRALGVPSGCVYLEISEQHELLPRQDLDHLISAYRSQGYHIALDDYGVGFGHMRALFLTNPELVKIDRFFFQGIERDAKRQLFVRRLTEFAHEIGAKVVAEALESEQAVTSALSLGVDYLQGFVLHRPSHSIHRDLVVDGHRIRLARRRGGRRRSALTRELRC